MSLQDRIKFLLSEKNIKQSHAAKDVGLTKSAIGNWYHGRTQDITSDSAVKLAKYFNVNYEWLINGKGPMRGEQIAIVGKADLNFVGDVEPVSYRNTVPLISFVQAGIFCEAIDNLIQGEPEQWLPCPVPHSRTTFALRVKGDSMTCPYPNNDSFPDGTIIFIDPEREYHPGSFVVAKILHSNEATFKKYNEDSGKKWLVPLNQMYEKIEVIEGMHICGTLIFAGKTY